MGNTPSAPSCTVGYYGSGSSCLPCPANAICPGGTAASSLCSTGQVVVSNTCQTARPVNIYPCPTGYSSSTTSDGLTQCTKSGIVCTYDSTGRLSSKKPGTANCPATITPISTSCANTEYQIVNSGVSYCLPACPANQIRGSSGLCAGCPAGSTYSAASNTCLPCGTLSIKNTVSTACICNSNFKAVKLEDGTCGCPAGAHIINGVCGFCSTTQTYSESLKICISCGMGMKSDGKGGPCMLTPSARARQREKRKSPESQLLEARVANAYKTTSREMQTKRNKALKKQERSTWL